MKQPQPIITSFVKNELARFMQTADLTKCDKCRLEVWCNVFDLPSGSIHQMIRSLKQATKGYNTMATTPQIDVKAPIAQLLAQLNTIRVAKSLTPLKKWPRTRGDLVREIAKMGVTVKKAPTVVANGAYVSEREAVARTGHTTNGKTRSQAKHEAAVAKHVAGTTTPATSKKRPATSQAPKKDVPANAFTLASWARDNGISPKVARARARKHVKELKPFAIDKYTYANKSRVKVNTILGGKK